MIGVVLVKVAVFRNPDFPAPDLEFHGLRTNLSLPTLGGIEHGVDT